MLAQPYGFKRVMSSYDFSDTDQGPPGSPPNSITNGACGNGWICEHRWSTISNMVQVSGILNKYLNIKSNKGPDHLCLK